MRVLAVYSTDRLLGGGEISFTVTLKAAQANGWEVLAAVPSQGQLTEYLHRNGVPFTVLPQESLRGLRAARLIQPEPSWVKLVREYQPEIIHCNAVRPALYAQAVGRRCDVPLIFHARIAAADVTDPFLVPRVDGIICTSNVVRRRFRESGDTLLRIIYNAVEVGDFLQTSNANTFRSNWRQRPDDFLVGLPGRLSPDKGQLRLVKAAAILVAVCPNVRFVLIGEEDPVYPGYRDELRKALDSTGLTDRFVFAGFQEDMSSVYAALDAVVFPTSEEAFGRIAIEAGAARKPLVANDIEVVRELLPNPADDFVVNCDDADQFAGRMIRIIQDPEYRRQLSVRLYEHVQQTFGIQSHWEQVLQMYQDVIQKRGKL
jgi:glycosyltransferase involved in cell wall biosynthesis